MKEIILINGLPRSGKDTMADYLVKYHDYKKISFADSLKDIIAVSLDISRETLDNFKNDDVQLRFQETNGYNEKLMNFRTLLQRFGTEATKPIFGNDIWSRLLYEKIMKSEHNKFVVPDFRFLIEYVPSNNYKLKTILVKDERELPTVGHASDVELYQNDFDFDCIIENLGTLDDYYNNIANLDIL
jgi:hypothetical protein